MYTIARYDLPHTLLLFPRFAQDWEYTYEKLCSSRPTSRPSAGRRRSSAGPSPELIHEEPLTVGRAGQDATRAPSTTGASRGRCAACASCSTGTRPARRRPTPAVSDADADRVVDARRELEHRAASPSCASGRCGTTRAATSTSSSATAARPTGRSRCCAASSSAGWLRLEVAPGGSQARRVARPLGRDEPGPLRRLLGLGRRVPRARLARRPGHARRPASNAALTCARMQWPPPEFVHPDDRRGAAARAAPDSVAVPARPRPGARTGSHASFRYRDEVDPDAFGGKVAYDVGAAYYAALCRAGLDVDRDARGVPGEVPPLRRAHLAQGGQRRGRRGGSGPSSSPSSGSCTRTCWRARASRWGDTDPGRRSARVSVPAARS